MAQCMAGSYWWHASFHASFQQQLSAHMLSRSATQKYSNSSIPSLLSHSVWEDFILPRFGTEAVISEKCSATTSSPSIVCFRDDDLPFPEHLVGRSPSDLNVRTSLEIRYSPWAVHMMNGFGKKEGNKLKESTGGPPGGGNGADDGGGDGGGGGGDDDGEEHIFLLPVLTLAFAAFHLGYCIAIWIKDENLDFEFFRTGLILFGLLAVAAIRLNARTGIDAYILGLGASVGVMVWTGERCLVKREGSPAGIVALFAASMAVMFTAALYHNI
ncbi:hypothetical protein Mapa_015482 [Marchantia paleacea]|nr:hypothetical protein Mapa_015482 [Marchantia paleacea]